jgi:hypothetical protein
MDNAAILRRWFEEVWKQGRDPGHDVGHGERAAGRLKPNCMLRLLSARRAETKLPALCADLGRRAKPSLPHHSLPLLGAGRPTLSCRGRPAPPPGHLWSACASCCLFIFERPGMLRRFASP